jgi:hypothetical protein
MDKPGDADSPDLMTHRQIINRFEKLFGGKMTARERDIFFLPDDTPSAEEEK